VTGLNSGNRAGRTLAGSQLRLENLAGRLGYGQGLSIVKLFVNILFRAVGSPGENARYLCFTASRKRTHSSARFASASGRLGCDCTFMGLLRADFPESYSALGERVNFACRSAEFFLGLLRRGRVVPIRPRLPGLDQTRWSPAWRASVERKVQGRLRCWRTGRSRALRPSHPP